MFQIFFTFKYGFFLLIFFRYGIFKFFLLSFYFCLSLWFYAFLYCFNHFKYIRFVLLFSFSSTLSKFWILFVITNNSFRTLCSFVLWFVSNCKLLFPEAWFFSYWIPSSLDYKRVAIDWCYRFPRASLG